MYTMSTNECVSYVRALAVLFALDHQQNGNYWNIAQRWRYETWLEQIKTLFQELKISDIVRGSKFFLYCITLLHLRQNCILLLKL